VVHNIITKMEKLQVSFIIASLRVATLRSFSRPKQRCPRVGAAKALVPAQHDHAVPFPEQ
jgi:hypothetical protein